MRSVVKATQTDAVGINTRVGMLDWTSVSTHLDDHGDPDIATPWA